MASLLTLLDITASVILGVAVLFFWFLCRRSLAPLPPGPKKLPLIGNLLDMPTEREWLKFTEWANKYGGHLAIIFVFLTSNSAAQEIWCLHLYLDSISLLLALRKRP